MSSVIGKVRSVRNKLESLRHQYEGQLESLREQLSREQLGREQLGREQLDKEQLDTGHSDDPQPSRRHTSQNVAPVTPPGDSHSGQDRDSEGVRMDGRADLMGTRMDFSDLALEDTTGVDEVHDLEYESSEEEQIATPKTPSSTLPEELRPAPAGLDEIHDLEYEESGDSEDEDSDGSPRGSENEAASLGGGSRSGDDKDEASSQSERDFSKAYTALLSSLEDEADKRSLTRLWPRLEQALHQDRPHPQTPTTDPPSDELSLLRVELEAARAHALTEQHSELTEHYSRQLEQLQGELRTLQGTAGRGNTTKELETNTATEISQTHNREVQELKVLYEKQLSDKDETHHKELDSLKSKYETEIKVLKHSGDSTSVDGAPQEIFENDATGTNTDSKLVSQQLITKLQEEVEMYKSQIETLKTESQPNSLEEWEERIAAMEDEHLIELKDMESKMKNLKDEHFRDVEELQLKVTEYEDHLQELETKKEMEDYEITLNTRSLEDEIERLTDEITEKEDEISSLKKSISNDHSLEDELDKMTEELTARDRELVTLKRKHAGMANLEEEIKNLREELADKKEEVSEMKIHVAEASSLEEENHRLTELIDEQVNEIGSLKEKVNELEQMEEEMGSLKVEVNRRKEDVDKFKKKLAQTVSLDEEIERLSGELHARESEIQDMKSSIGSSKSHGSPEDEVEELRKVLVTREETLTVIRREMAEKHQIHVDRLMEDLSKQHQSEIERLNVQIKELKSGRTSGDGHEGSLPNGDVKDSASDQDLEQKYHDELHEFKVKLERENFEEIENFRNSLAKKHELEVNTIKMQYAELMESKEQKIQDRIEREVKNVRLEMEGTMETELEALKDTLRGQYEVKFSEKDDETRKMQIGYEEKCRELEQKLEESEGSDSNDGSDGEDRVDIDQMRLQMEMEYQLRASDEAEQIRQEVEDEFSESIKSLEKQNTEYREQLNEDAQLMKENEELMKQTKEELDTMKKRDEDLEEQNNKLEASLQRMRCEYEMHIHDLKIELTHQSKDEESLEADAPPSEEKWEPVEIPPLDLAFSKDEDELDASKNHQQRHSTPKSPSKSSGLESMSENQKYKLEELQQIVNNLESQRNEQYDMLNDYEERIEQLEQEVEHSKDRVQVYQHKLEQREHQFEEQQKMSDSFDQERQELFERIDEYERRLSDFDKGKGDESKWRDKVEQTEQRCRVLESEIAQAKSKMEEYKKEVLATERDYEKGVVDYESRIEELNNKINQMDMVHQDKLDDLLDQLQAHHDTEDSADAMKDLQAKLAAAEEKLRLQEESSKVNEDIVKDLRSTIADYECSIADKNEENKRNAEMVVELESRVAELMGNFKTKEEELEIKITTYEGWIEDLKQQLDENYIEEITQKHKVELEQVNLEKQATEDKLGTLLRGIVRGDAPEVMSLRTSLEAAHSEQMDQLRARHTAEVNTLAGQLQKTRLLEDQPRLDVAPTPRSLDEVTEATGASEEAMASEASHIPEDSDTSSNEIEQVASKAVQSVIQGALGQLQQEMTDKDVDPSSMPSNNNKGEQPQEEDYSDSFEQDSQSSSTAEEIIEEEIIEEIIEEDGENDTEEFSLDVATAERLQTSETDASTSVDESLNLKPAENSSLSADAISLQVVLEEDQTINQASLTQFEITELHNQTPLLIDFDRSTMEVTNPDVAVTEELLVPITTTTESSPAPDRTSDDEAEPSIGNAENEQSVEVVNEAAEMLKRHQLELEDIRTRHMEDLEDVRIAIKVNTSNHGNHGTANNHVHPKYVLDKAQTELLNDNLRKLETMTSDLEKSHHQEIEEIRKHYDDQVRLLEARLRGQEEEARVTLDAQTDRLRADHEQRQELLKHELQAAHHTQLSSTTLHTDDSELDAAHQLEITQLCDAHRAQLDQLGEAHARQLAALEAGYKATVEQLESKLGSPSDEVSSSQFTASLQQELATLRAQLSESDAKDHTITDLTAQLDALKLEPQLGKDEQLEQLSKQLEDYEQLVSEYREQCEEDKQRIDHLTKTGHDDKEKVTSLQSELDRLRSFNFSESDEVTRLKGALAAAESRLSEQQREADSRMEQLTQGKQTELTTVQSRLESEITVLRASLEAVSMDTAASVTDRQRVAEGRIAMETVRERHAQELERAEERRAELESVVTRLEGEIARRGDEIDTYKRQVSRLEQRLEEQRSDHELVLGRREREHQEGTTLLGLLQTDLNQLTGERDATHTTNASLLRLLSESMKINLSVEDKISRRLAALVAEGGQGNSQDAVQGAGNVSAASVLRAFVGEGATAGKATSSQGGVSSPDEDSTPHNTSLTSAFSDEGLELSQRISESIFCGPDLDTDGEEIVLDTGHRVQTSVDRLLDMLTETHRQLTDAQSSQRSLITEAEGRQRAAEALTQRCEDAEGRLQDETEAREYLAAELHKAEGLIQGYQTQTSELSTSIVQLEDRKEALISDLEHLRRRLTELEEVQLDVAAREDDLERQRAALTASVGDEDRDSRSVDVDSSAALLAENARLSESQRTLERQYSSDRRDLSARLSAAEDALTEVSAESDTQLTDAREQVDELQIQVEVLEKQLKNNRQFLDDQAVEREQEREEFQRDIDQLTGRLRDREKVHSAGQRLNREDADEEDAFLQVQDLEDQLRDRADALSEETLRRESLERDTGALTVTVTELRATISTLEGELGERARAEASANEKLSEAQSALSALQEANSSLHTSLAATTAGTDTLASLRRLVADLEAQLDTVKADRDGAWESVGGLRDELTGVRNKHDELCHDKETLQQQVYDQLHQISALRVQVDGHKLAGPPGSLTGPPGATPTGPAGDTETDRQLGEQLEQARRQLEDEREAVERKQHEVSELSEQLDQFRDQLLDRDEEIQQLAAQLEVETAGRRADRDQLERVATENDRLQTQVQQSQDAASSTLMPVFAQNLIDDKNAEIDHLGAQIDRLREDLVQAQMVDTQQGRVQELCRQLEDKNSSLSARGQEIEELRSLVETMKEADRLASEATTGDVTPVTPSIVAQYDRQLFALRRELREKDELIESGRVAMVADSLNEVDSLNRQIVEKDETIKALVDKAEAFKSDLLRQVSITQDQEAEISRLSVTAADRDAQIAQLTAQVDSLTTEVSNLTDFQTRLQEDYDTLQGLLEKKEREFEDLTAELETTRRQGDGVTDLQVGFEREIAALQRDLEEKENIIEEKAEELYLANEGLDKKSQQVQELEIVLDERDEEILHMQNSLADAQNDKQEALTSALSAQERRLSEAAAASRTQLTAQHGAEIQRLVTQHRAEMATIQQGHDLSDDDSLAVITTRRLPREVQKSEQLTARLHNSLGASSNSSTNGDQEGFTNRLKTIITKVHTDGADMLTLSEKDFLASLGQGPPHTSIQMAWDEEKKSLLATIKALRELLADMQKTRDASKIASLLANFMTDPQIWVMSHYGGSDLSSCDWRLDLLRAVHNVFSTENAGLLAALHTHRVVHGPGATGDVGQLEERVEHQEASHREAFQSVMSADRQSLLSEVRQLTQDVATLRHAASDGRHDNQQQVAALEESHLKRETQLQRQAELLEYKIQQERVLSEDLRVSLATEKSRAASLGAQLSAEKVSNTELSTEIDDTQTQLNRLKDALAREQGRLVSASSALDGERQKNSSLSEAVLRERQAGETVRDTLETERVRHGQATEKLKHDLASERERQLEATAKLEREKLTLSGVKRDLDAEKEQHHVTETKFKVKVADLKASLEMERARTNELSSSLQRERQLVSSLRDTLTEERGSQHTAELRERATNADLAASLDLERSRVLELQAALERERAAGGPQRATTGGADVVERERAVNRQLKNNIDALQLQKQELSRDLDYSRGKLSTLTADRDRLQESLASSRSRLAQLEGRLADTEGRHSRATAAQDRRGETDRSDKIRQDTEVRHLQTRLASLELQLAESRRLEVQAREDRETERLRATMSPHRHKDHTDAPRQCSHRSSPGRSSSRAQLCRRQLDMVRQKVQLVLIQHQEHVQAATASDAGGMPAPYSSELTSASRSLKEVLQELQELHSSMVTDSEGQLGSASVSVPALNERILQHNSELTHFISKLSDEKQDLRRTMTKLEEEIWNYRQREKVFIESENAEAVLSSERARWSEDRSTLVLRVSELERQLGQTKDALRHAEIELEREREKYLRPHVGGDSDKADADKIQRLYSKYLRAESFRKALVYQKKYLLILLGGFRDCEEETLATIARMGGYPAPGTVCAARKPAPYGRFRSVVRVVIAVSRLKFLVKKWRRAARVGAPVMAGSLPHDHGPSHIPPVVNGFSTTSSQSSRHGHRLHTTASDPATYGQSKPASDRLAREPISSHNTSRTSSVHVNGRLGDTPPTRDLGNLRKYRETTSQLTASHARRQILSALDPLRGPTATPPPSVSGGGDTPRTDIDDDDDEAIDNYIQRLEHLQARLGSVNQTSKGVHVHVHRR